MTAPDDMPDHIWAQTHPGTDRQGRWSAVDLNTYAPASKYVRADVVYDLVRALEPFAKSGELFPEDVGTCEFDTCVYAPAAGKEYNLCGDDLRRARAALDRYRGDTK